MAHTNRPPSPAPVASRATVPALSVPTLTAHVQNELAVSMQPLENDVLSPEVLDRIARVAAASAARIILSLNVDESRSDPNRPDHPSSDENEAVTGVPQPAEIRIPQPFQPPPGKKRVPRANQDKFVDEALRKFLESKGVLATKDYFPDGPEQRLVDSFEQNGVPEPDLNAPRICLAQTFKGKWNKEVVELLTAAFITAVENGEYESVQITWPQMVKDNVRKKCQNKLYRTQYLCRTRGRRSRADSDKVNRMYQRRQETYYRRRRIYDLNNHRDPAAWEGVRVLLDGLGTLGTSDDETEDEISHPAEDSRFKRLRRVDTGFLNPAISKIWESVETYPSSLRISRGNRSFKRIARAKTTSKRTPLPGLPMNFYDPEWLDKRPLRFQGQVKPMHTLPVLMAYEGEDVDMM